jgi:two-component system chemotaxis response regulator CheY
MIEKEKIKYGYPIKKVNIIGDNILLVTDESIKVLDKSNLSPKNSIPISSIDESVFKNKIVTSNDEVQVIDFLEDKVISRFSTDSISSIELSAVLIAIGKENGAISIHSVIGGKNLLTLNIFKAKIKKLSFYDDSIVFVQSENQIKGVDIIDKKISFKISDNSIISTFKVVNDKLFFVNIKGELKVYDLNSNSIVREIELKELVEKIDVINNFLIIKYKYKLEALNLNTYKRITIDSDIEFIDFSVGEDEIIAIDGKFDIVKYSLVSIIEDDTENDLEEVIEDSAMKIKFLTVDDSSTMRLIIKNSLLNNFDNVEVFEAADGLKCLEVLKKNPDINVIFMDWNMPNLNGAEAVDKIRENPVYNHIKIIMATTEGAREKVRQMVSKGVKGYLVKPFKPESVVPLAKKMIEMVEEENNV